jgi:hypothetical protein
MAGQEIFEVKDSLAYLVIQINEFVVQLYIESVYLEIVKVIGDCPV